ncbi:MAG: DUF3592 domain-containing protein [Lachnospiraceae bacterium]|nr:DUF3592 domain-containing protein [Lachnospiraceae bacterium]
MILATGLALIIVGILFLVMYPRSKRKANRHIAQTTGIVADEKIQYDDGGSPEFYNYSFTYTVDGQEYTTKKIQWVMPNRPSVGDTVRISYNPLKPSDANATDNEIPPTKAFLIIGAVLCVIGLILVII